jgi:16S rRNA (adenine1518-N6/adenine1519-N6)-dimethyltransferase
VIEIGPGLGGLTDKLADGAGRVVAIEIDSGLCAYLREHFASRANLIILEQDALLADPKSLLGEGNEYVLAGNLPYNAGLAIVRHFLEAEVPPTRAVVMLQKEVADGIVAGAGKMTLAGIGVQVFATPRRLFDVAPSAFYPPPRVRSTVVSLDVRETPLVPAGEQQRFFRVVRAGFSAPRKQLHNSVIQGLNIDAETAERALAAAEVDPALRPADLGIADWLRLSREVGRQIGH